MQHLYRHFDKEGRLLYVGVSVNALVRLTQHRQTAHWFDAIARVDIETLDSREEVLAAEAEAIAAENPAHNLRRPTPSEEKAVADKWEDSRVDLRRKLVSFDPIYTPAAAAAVLDVSLATVTKWCESNQMGSVVTKSGSRTFRRITGWQLIDFLETWEREGEI